IPLEVGKTYTYDRYFMRKNNPVVINVVRKETKEVPAGKFDCIVVQPTITNAGGLFGKGGKAELFFTDDAARQLVYMRSERPVMGWVRLQRRWGGRGRAVGPATDGLARARRLTARTPTRASARKA